jgi:uncharacterized protein (DUF1778 family)
VPQNNFLQSSLPIHRKPEKQAFDLCATLVHNPGMATIAQRRTRNARRLPKRPKRRRSPAPMRNLAAHKSERLVARVSSEDKAIISQAAAMAGQSVGSFMLAETRRAALQTLEARQRIVLNAEQSRRLVEALLAPPPPPTPRMIEAMRLYKATVKSDLD